MNVLSFTAILNTFQISEFLEQEICFKHLYYKNVLSIKLFTFICSFKQLHSFKNLRIE